VAITLLYIWCRQFLKKEGIKMRTIQELLDRIIPFVVVPYEGVGDGVPENTRRLKYLHELELEEVDFVEEVHSL
jgi:hypothetical protein